MTSSPDQFLRIDSITRPALHRPETSQNRRALLVRGGRFGGCDAKTLTSKLSYLLNLPEIHHIPPLQTLSKSHLFFTQLCLGYFPDCISENATQAILEQTVRLLSVFVTLNLNQGHTIPILIQKSFCSDNYLWFQHHFCISPYHSSAEDEKSAHSIA